jgi:uncharacterized protein
MDEITLARTIEQTFEYVRQRLPHGKVDFIWHGGEPMLAGLQFYETAVDLQRQCCQSIEYTNAIQTNGTFIDEEWLIFFKKEEFGVSISIDGPSQIHDSFRKNRGGKGSFATVRRAVELVRAAQLPFGVCAVISKANVHRAKELYDFFATEQLPFNPIPLNRSGSARENYLDVGLEPEEYADAWIPMYDRWFDAEDGQYVYCSDFVNKTRAILGGRPMDCVGLSQCSATNISVDPIGDVYPCASLSGTKPTKYGNLLEMNLLDIMETRTASEYQTRAVDPQCATCKWQHVCHGGCQARAYKFFGTNNRRDYYCPSLFRIYEHVESRLFERLGDVRLKPEDLDRIALNPNLLSNKT